MNLSKGAIAGALVAMAGGAAVAGYAIKHKQPAYAQVVDVQPVQKTIRTPRQECHEDARTVASATKRCVTVYDMHIERSGYDVRYRIGEREGTVRMDHDPGKRIPLRQGQLVLDAHTGAG